MAKETQQSGEVTLSNGASMTIEEIYALPVDGGGWRVLPNGNNVWLGVGVRLGINVRLDNGVRLDKTPLAVQGSRHLAGNYEPGVIQIGCQNHSFEHWTAHVLGIARQNGYTAEEGLEYQRIIAFLIAEGTPATAKERAERPEGGSDV